MATLNPATTTASQRRSPAITVASTLYFYNGLAFLIASPLVVIYTLHNRKLPVILGIELLSGPFSQRLGPRAVIAASVPWTLVNVLEVVAGYWLWKSRKQGGKLGLMLFPVGMMFWIWYALPFPIVIGPLRVLLLAKRWKTLR